MGAALMARSHTAPRTIAILACHRFVDLARNPAMVISALVPIALGLMYRTSATFGFDIGDISAGWLSRALYILVFEGIMGATMFALLSLAESHEQGSFATLSRAGVTPGEIVCAQGLAATAMTALASGVCYAALGMDAALALPLLAVFLLTYLPLIVASLALAQRIRTQMGALAASLPIMVVGLLPFVALMIGVPASLIPLLPTGAFLPLCDALATGTLTADELAIGLGTTALWLAASGIALAVTLKQRR